ncbi:hypothetical protein GOP47_0013105 [Adiantum capillus-veneris]|uniref:Uncharacterized protein n=1 Tax=Adiantum capillus-veneris TaxID=13818 RepID=A0A9D4ZF08_ADICA|nr:hypothetical protein GOP47_0013105 [Adiantum capillus-veneris]
MLLIDILLKVALQAVLHRLQSSLDADYVIESPLAGKSLMMYGADASKVGEHNHFMYQEGLWIQVVKGLWWGQLHAWLAYRFTGAKWGWFVYILQMGGNAQNHRFYPGGAYTTLGKSRGFPFDPGDSTTYKISLYLSIYIQISVSLSIYCLCTY